MELRAFVTVYLCTLGMKLRVQYSHVICADEGWNTVHYSFVMQLLLMR